MDQIILNIFLFDDSLMIFLPTPLSPTDTPALHLRVYAVLSLRMAWLDALPKEFEEAQAWLNLLRLPCGDAWVKSKIVSVLQPRQLLSGVY